MKGTPKQVGYPYNQDGQRETRERMRAFLAQKPQTQVGVTASQTNDALEYASHPKYAFIQSWIGESAENRQWIEKNKSTLFSDPESITIAGFALALKPLEGLHRYADGLKKLGDTSHKKYPDWRSIASTLPGNGINKSKFIQNVLGLTLGGYRIPTGDHNDQGDIGYAWSSVSVGTKYELLEFTSDDVTISNDNPSFALGVLGCK